MNTKLLLSRLSLFGILVLFISGCYTQVSTVKKTSGRDYEPVMDDQAYEQEYQEEADTVYIEEEEQEPLYQYNFYGYDPFSYNMHYSPYYSGISFHFGDPWFYDPFYDPWYNPYRGYWRPYDYWGLGGWGYGGYGGGYYGFSSPYYGSYDPYWGYYNPNGNYVTVKPRKRRDFDYRRGLAGRTTTTSSDPILSTVTARNKNVSRIERVRKTTTKPGDRNRVATVTSRERTGDSKNLRPRTVSSKPVRKKSSQGRLTRTPVKVRSKTPAKSTSNRSRITNNKRTRTTKSVPSVSRNRSTTRTKPKATSGVRRSKTTKTYSPPASRNRSGSSGRSSSGSSVKPRTSGSSGSSGRSVRTTTTTKTSSGSKSSSGRTKKK